jgi:C-terminal processing protease CtpA/Prc
MSGVSEGFLFDDAGRLTAITVIDKEEDSKIQVLDLSNIKSRILGAAELELVISYGIKGQKVTADIEELVGKNLPDGMYVTYVEVDSPAYRAGIMVGDIIYRINTYTISDLYDVRIVIDSKKVGDVISTHLYRNMGTKYNTYTLPVELSHKNDKK